MEPSVQANRTGMLSIAEPTCPSPHPPEDPGPSTRHIRFSTPPSLYASSPELSSSGSRRVRMRPESPSALAILAAVCSSPSVRWDGVKHQYGEGHGKSIWCEDLRMAHGPSRQAHIVDPSSPNLPLVYGERSFTIRDTIQPDMESYGIGDMQKVSVPEEIHYPAVEDEDEDIPAPKLPADQDYFSEIPSSPPTLVSSSPYNGMSYDFSSSSERSSTLPLSSPGLPNQHKISFATRNNPTYDARVGDTTDHIASAPQESISTVTVKQDAGFTPSTSESGHTVIIPAAEQTYPKFYDVDVPATDCEPTCTPSLSPLQAPEPLPHSCADLSISPLSSLMSSPFSEIMDNEPPPPAPSRFSIFSDAISARSTSPDTDIDAEYLVKSNVTGRRASTNVIGTRIRRMSGLTSSTRWRRSDTAPPESTPCKRPRHSSPSSPPPRPLQLRRLSSSRSSSPCVSGPSTSSALLEENQRVRRKEKHKVQSAKASTPLKVKRTVEPLHPDSATLHRPPKHGKGKSVPRRLDGQSDTSSAASELRDLSPTELTALPVTGFLVETLALSRASAITAPELLRAVLKSQPHLMEERSEKLWLELVRCILQKVRMFGRIERRGTDAADRPLEDQWFYIPENDEEDGRAELLKGLMPKKRDVTKRSKQYYFEPVQKVSRWDPEDD